MKCSNLCDKLLLGANKLKNPLGELAEPLVNNMVEANHSEEWDVPNGTPLEAGQSSRALRLISRAVSCQTKN